MPPPGSPNGRPPLASTGPAPSDELAIVAQYCGELAQHRANLELEIVRLRRKVAQLEADVAAAGARVTELEAQRARE